MVAVVLARFVGTWIGFSMSDPLLLPFSVVSEVGTSARATTGILDHCLAIAEERKRFAERLRGIANAVMQYKNTQKQIRKNVRPIFGCVCVCE